MRLIFDGAGAELINGMSNAIQCLQGLIESGSDTVKMRASKALLELAIRFKEFGDLEQRLQELERIAMNAGADNSAAQILEMVRSGNDESFKPAIEPEPVAPVEPTANDTSEWDNWSFEND